MIALARPVPAQNPRRQHALALSAALHLALAAAWIFGPAPAMVDPAAGTLPIELVVEAPPPEPEPKPAPKPEPPPQAQPQPQPEKPAPAKRAPAARPAAPKAAPAADAPAPVQVQAQAEATLAEPAPALQPTVQAAPPAEAGAAAPIGAPESLSAARDDYVRVVWNRILRYRPARVPVQGVTRLRFTVAADGELVAAEVAETSGSALLDRAALDAVRRAAPFPPPPAALAATPLHRFEIPFQFRPADR